MSLLLVPATAPPVTTQTFHTQGLHLATYSLEPLPRTYLTTSLVTMSAIQRQLDVKAKTKARCSFFQTVFDEVESLN